MLENVSCFILALHNKFPTSELKKLHSFRINIKYSIDIYVRSFLCKPGNNNIQHLHEFNELKEIYSLDNLSLQRNVVAGALGTLWIQGWIDSPFAFMVSLCSTASVHQSTNLTISTTLIRGSFGGILHSWNSLWLEDIKFKLLTGDSLENYLQLGEFEERLR